MAPTDGKAFNCYFPMPFLKKARIQIMNEGEIGIQNFYAGIDYETYDEVRLTKFLKGKKPFYFHAQWRRENPTVSKGTGYTKAEWDAGKRDLFWSTVQNMTGEGNYVMLEAKGSGYFVGCHLDVDCYPNKKRVEPWYGEGDEIIWVDGKLLRGTGTEDFFCTAWCPHKEYSGLYHGISNYNGTVGNPEVFSTIDWEGKNSLWRYFIEEPVHFNKEIKVTIEHSHANSGEDDYSSTVYWYQQEPHALFPKMLSAKERLPREY